MGTPMPTPAPTPMPTLTATTTSSEPTCELERNAKTCMSQGGSFECESCANDITGELCCSCQSVEVSATTPASTLATTTTFTSGGLCKPWCASNPKSWDKKCSGTSVPDALHASQDGSG